MTPYALILSIVSGALISYSLIVYLSYGLSKDDTDPEKGSRSNLMVFTDHKTGLQYLSSTPLGGLTPRLDEDGYHMRKEK